MDTKSVNEQRLRIHHGPKYDVRISMLDRSSGEVFKKNIGPVLYDALIRRNTHAVTNSVLLIKLQYVEKCVWLAHTGEPLNLDLTVMNALPFRYDRFRDTMRFHQIGSTKNFLRGLQLKPPLHMIVFLAHNARFDFERVVENVPASIRSHGTESEDYFSSNLYDTVFFRYITERSILTTSNFISIKGTLVREVAEPLDLEVPGVSLGRLAFVYKPSQIYRLGLFLDTAVAFESPKTGFLTNEVIQVDKIRKFESRRVMKGSPFTHDGVEDTVLKATAILRSLGVPVNSIGADLYLVFEAITEAAFVHETIFGPFKMNDELTVPIHSYLGHTYRDENSLASDYNRYRVRSFQQHASWLVVIKVIMRYGCKTLRSFGLLKAIFDLVSSIYQSSSSSSTSSSSMPAASTTSTTFSDTVELNKAIYLALFANADARVLHDLHLRYPDLATGCPFPMPSIFHVGYYTVHQLAEFFSVNHGVFSVSLGVSMAFSGFVDYTTAGMWLAKDSTVVQELRPFMESSPMLAGDDWSGIDERMLGLQNRPTLEQAIDASAPTVIFGNTKLRIEMLGDAMRRVFLAANRFGADSAYTREVLKAMKKGPVGSIASVLLRLQRLSKKQSSTLALKDLLAASATIKAHLNKDALDARVSNVVSYPYATAISSALGTGVKKGASLFVLTTTSGMSIPTNLKEDTKTVLALLKSYHERIIAAIRLDTKTACSLAPARDSLEQQLLDDVLLITWFLQSPIFTKAPLYTDHTVLIRQSDPTGNTVRETGSVRRNSAPTLYNMVGNVVGTSHMIYRNFELYRKYLNGIVNTRQHGVLSSTVISNTPYDDLAGYLFRDIKIEQGSKFVQALPKRVLSLKDAASVSGVEDLSVLLPMFRADKNLYEPGMRFLDDVGSIVFNATSRRKPLASTGLAMRRLFENESLRPAGDSRVQILTEENYLSWTALRELSDRFYSDGYVFERTTPITFPDLLAPSGAPSGTGGGMDFSKRVFLYTQRRLASQDKAVAAVTQGAAAPLFNRMVRSRFANGIQFYTTGKSGILPFMRQIERDYLGADVELDLDGFEALHTQVYGARARASADPGSLTLTVHRSPVATFAFYESVKLESQQILLSPLEVFRTVSRLGLAANVSASTLKSWKNFPEGEALSTNSGQKTDQDYQLSISARTGWSPNEFYGEIQGYVTRGLDNHATLEETERGNGYSHYASSRSMHAVRQIEQGVHESGLVPVYDATLPSLEHGQWRALSIQSNTVAVQDLVRKQWALHPRDRFVKGNVIGLLAGEVNPIELVIESADVFDPGMEEEANARTRHMAERFSANTLAVATEAFSPLDLYPVGEYEWFQYTDVVPLTTVPYRMAVFDKKLSSGGTIHYGSGQNAAATKETVAMLGPHAYRARVCIHGYQISGARFSSRVRYVRYTEDPRIANATFVKVPREGLAAYGDEPLLSYWALTATRDIQAGTEIVVMVPTEISPRINWRKLLLSGYATDDVHSNSHGHAWDSKLTVVPNMRPVSLAAVKLSIIGFHASIPVTSPRMLTVAQEELLLSLSLPQEVTPSSSSSSSSSMPQASTTPAVSTPFASHIDAMTKFVVSDEAHKLTHVMRLSSANVVPLSKKLHVFPNNLVARTQKGLDDDDPLDDDDDYSQLQFFEQPATPSSVSDDSVKEEEETETESEGLSDDGAPSSTPPEEMPLTLETPPAFVSLPSSTPVALTTQSYPSSSSSMITYTSYGETFPADDPYDFTSTFIGGFSPPTLPGTPVDPEEAGWFPSRRG